MLISDKVYNGLNICAEDCNNCSYCKLPSTNKSLSLIKQKVSTKYFPPDLSAIKALQSLNNQPSVDYSNLPTDKLIFNMQQLLNQAKQNKGDS